MKPKQPKLRVYRKLPPSFASDYIKTLRLLSRKHKLDDTEVVKSTLRLLRNMSDESFYAGRGEVWIPKPHLRSGYYPIIEKVPYTMVRRAIRSNTSEVERARAWGVVASSVEPFLPLHSRRPGSLTEAQRRSLLAHAIVALPFVKGRHPALLGKRVPGELGVSDIGTRSIIPIKRMAPEDWEKGFTMRKFSLSEDLSQAIKRKLTATPHVPNPSPQAPKTDLKEVLRRAMDTKPKLEPEQRDYQRDLATTGTQPRFRKATRVKVRLRGPHTRRTTAARWMGRHSGKLHAGAFTAGLIGTSAVATALAARRRRKQHQYTLSDIDYMYYEDGFGEWLRRAKRKTKRVWKKAVGWTKGVALPAIARDVTLAGVGLAHTELGLPPTTVDLLPVQRIGLKRDLQPLPSIRLRKVVASLQESLVSEADPVLRKGLEKGISEIATELLVRRSMSGHIGR